MAETLKNPKIDPFKGIVKNGRIIAPPNTVIRLPVDMIRPDPDQVRQHIDTDELADLIASIKLVGQRTPIDILLRDSGKWAIIDDGERRWRAVKANNLPTIKCIIRSEEFAALRKFSPKIAKLISGAIANMGRSEMSIIDKAEAIQGIMDKTGWNQGQAGQVLCMRPWTVTETMKVLKLIPEIREMLVRKQIKPGEAIAVSFWPPEKQLSQLEVIQQLKERLGKAPKAEDMHYALKSAGEAGGFQPRPPSKKGRKQLAPIEIIMRKTMRLSRELVRSLEELSKRPESVLAEQKNPSYYDLHQELLDLSKHLTREIGRASAQL